MATSEHPKRQPIKRAYSMGPNSHSDPLFLEPQIGKYYLVQCVRTKWKGSDTTDWLPILGPKHDDNAIIHFPWVHWHLDFRFISDRLLDRLLNRILGTLTWPQENQRFALLIVQHASSVLEGPMLRLLKCKRLMPTFPWDSPTWESVLRRLENVYEGCCFKPARPICPHQGIPLCGLPSEDGVVVCPGHGLSWDLRTGKLVRRTGKEDNMVQKPDNIP